MDLTGIENEAEFFPAGTLSDVLEVELQDITGRWSREFEGANPVTRLSGAADTYLRLYRQLLNTTDKNLRNELYSQSVALVSTSLGYNVKRSSETLALDAGSLARVMNKTFDADGKQTLWIIETPAPATGEEQGDPLGLAFDREQYDSDEQEHAELEKTIEELLADGIFGLPEAPRYVLVAGASQWVLVDQRKWPARSVLRFDLQEIFSRQDRDTFRVMACLAAREARVPATGIPIADRLEEEAQRNANAVTTSLKRTVRDAIEILGQEVLDVTGGKFPTGPKRGVWIDGPTLSLECLRYMYRLLFLLYAESNPRLRILDLKDPLYASGYSMEALRDLESVRLRTPQEKNGSYLWASLQQVLTLLYSGESHVLKLPAVKVSLLDPESTPLLNSVSLRNEAVQRIIRHLSLRSSKKSTGRISYSKLGIGQLGAVYETLISFTGTVAKEDMIELKGDNKDRAAVEMDDADVAGDEANEVSDVELGEEDEYAGSRIDKVDLLAPTYFVPRRRITEFNREAVVFEGGQAKIYAKGSFTYRLSGRDREKTAAYYTPEPLARLLVKHLLMERCKDLAADEILELKILEPAMGSAAFLVETTNQLADLYLERKQIEVGQIITQEEILLEKQKVRSYIADRNCFGVDLNPTAVELGAISLWLNGLHKGDFSPWFGDQLHAGNSLIGARRAVYPVSQLRGRTADLWFKNPPKEIGWKEERPENTVYQWLLPAEDMSAFEKDKTIKEFAGDHQARIKTWRAGGFFKPFESHEINLVKRLTNVADELFDIVASEIARTRDAANDEITIWPNRKMSGAKGVGYQKKEILKQRLLGEDHAHNTLPFKRLKTAMDAWCALWLWPIDKADKLPSRQEFLEGMRILLEGGFSVDGSLSAGTEDDFAVVMGDLFDQQPAEPVGKYNVGLFQETNVEAFIEEYDWLQIATEVANEARFVHYDLIFADILKARGGFDLIVGNPPWAKNSWNEGQVLSDIDPIYSGLSAVEARNILNMALAKIKGISTFLDEYSLSKGSMKVTSSETFYAFAGSGQNNLYACFMDLGFRLVSRKGNIALIHQDGHLKETASQLRRHWYQRIIKHFEFANKISSKNFAEVLHTVRFSLNIYRGYEDFVKFDQITNAFLAGQIDDCYAHTGGGTVPLLRNEDNGWNTEGHRKRIYSVEEKDLSVYRKILNTEGDELDARLIQLLSENQKEALSAFENCVSIEEKYGQVQIEPMFHESASQKEGILKKKTHFPNKSENLVISGPNIYVSNPLYKCARRFCTSPQQYDNILLDEITGNYLPRTNFEITSNYREIKSIFDPTKKYNDLYRLAFRRRVEIGSERTFTSAIIPPGITHIAGIHSAAFEDNGKLLNLTALTSSLPYDFLFKALGKGDIGVGDFLAIPIVELGNYAQSLVLRLNCLTQDYEQLWNSVIRDCNFQSYGGVFSRFWNRDSALRSDLERRIALVDIDIVVAQALGWTIEILIDVYRLSFAVLGINEKSTWYDQNGKIVWTGARGLSGVGIVNEKFRSVSKDDWLELLKKNPREISCYIKDDTNPDGPKLLERTFVGPFYQVNREEDYRRRWSDIEALQLEGKL